MDEIRVLMATPDVVVGSIAAVTETGSLVAASATADEFYVRFGNTTRKLTHREADEYARDRWRVD
jgi:hypothetical protein